jgi:DNA polymerase-3 subunit chi
MTEVSFHFNAPDKLAYACRLLRKGHMKSARMVVMVDPDQLGALDAALWQVSTHDFLPHCTDQDPVHVRVHSPIQLVGGSLLNPEARALDVLVNLRQEMPLEFLSFAKVIEVVTQEEHDRQQARERWKLYRQKGIEPQRHDLQPLAAS